MYLLEVNEQGQLSTITVEPKKGLAGAYVETLPISIETMLENGTIEQIETNKYRIKETN